MNSFFTISTGALVAIPCALLGCFLVLRKMSMVGDAISHAVLPGIVIAFLLTHSLSSLPVLIGATIMGIFCTFLIEFFSKRAKIQDDASIGLAFTFLFALGVILIAVFAKNVDLDQDCVLHGIIDYVALDLPNTGTFLDVLPRPMWILGALTLVVFTFIGLGYKNFYLTTFDPDYAISIGISTAFWHYLLMGLVSATSVVAFESVGAVLVVAFLIAPAATAYLLTEKLPAMLFLSCLIGILSCIGGYYLAVYLNGSTTGAITTVMGILFVIGFLLSKMGVKI